ncbi:DUF5805 domain-containing protein [Natronococcus wangiae]|uniref:DUF5805 domain-containing protein n=1 Tax=Natronococcus wangiae TaxID=3068275 RepID=UPI00273D7DED|nr:DUF5805 domain-containing protein [Natronococcus sp. AD5]
MTDNERTTVQTYVPRYQKQVWSDHADELDMSQSEFVRTMVQAGRQDFDVPSLTSHSDENSETSTEDLEERILDVLNQEAVLDWDDLIERLVADIEDDVDAALGRLQDENLVRYSGRDGGYIRTDNE